MSICEKCKKRNVCKEICSELQKEISVRGVSPRRKDKTYLVDFNLLESIQHPDAFHLEIQRRIVQDEFIKELTGIDLEALMQKHLSTRQREAVQLSLEGYSQRKIASKMKISQQGVNLLIKKAVRKLKYFFRYGGCQKA